MAEETLLPIKVVFKQDRDNKPLPRTRRDFKVLDPVTPELRQRFSGQVLKLKEHFAGAFEKWPGLPAVAKVSLKNLAIAKSHRPSFLFNSNTCPIIGGGKLGELYIGILPTGLNELSNRILHSKDKLAEPNISTLLSIDPYTQEDAILGNTIADISSFAELNPTRPLKFRLFRHRSSSTNSVMQNTLIDYLRSLNVKEVESLDYAPSVSIFGLHGVPKSSIAKIANFIGTQSLSGFPNYRIVRSSTRVVADANSANFPPPEKGRNYCSVGIIDSGTDQANPHLQAWVESRHEHVPKKEQNNDHGSFVAGLIVHPRLLNHGDPRFLGSSSKIVDVVAIDKDGQIDEYDLRSIIDDSLQRFPGVRVWNMSLAMDGAVCSNHEFSEFGAYIDAKTAEYNVLFHLPAGNYNSRPMRSWPPDPSIGEADRICPPGDAVRAITVGAIAHREANSSRVRIGDPSPFGRRGPVGAYIIKPDLSHWAGNCDQDSNCLQTGILSLDGAGHIGESIGTSFACPPIASVSANVWGELAVGQYRPNFTLVKGLQMHAAFIQNYPHDAERMNYVGLGKSSDLSTIINCTQSAATLIFEIPINTSPLFVRRPFPMPKCLEDAEGHLVAEVFMTLCYDPPLDRKFGIEYCRSNATASLGTVEIDPKVGKDRHHRQINPCPKEVEKTYESELVKNGYKWAPLKFYYRSFHRVPGGKEWQLQLELLHRAEMASRDDQTVYLILTVRDPNRKALVYDAMVKEMNRMNWLTRDLEIRSRTRLQS